MTPDDFLADLYVGFDWRFDEIRHLKNLFATEQDEFLQNEYRKSLVVILYAHFEGFCVFALQHYLSAINKAKIDFARATPAILVGSCELVFNAMEYGDQKCKIFHRPLPADEGLHRHWRRRHFFEEIEQIMARPVAIPEKTIDAESNLKPEVLQRNMFLLGLDHHFVDAHISTIHNLLRRRNLIAHGVDRRGVTKIEYEDFDSAVFEICANLIELLDSAFRTSAFEKPSRYMG